MIAMKRLFATLGLLAFLAIPAQSAFAWEYDGLGSLNPFTNFGRGFGNSSCGCRDMARPKLTKCEKLHGYKIIKDEAPCGYAAPIIYETIVVPENHCNECLKAF
jgi:hypothetical protein